MIEYALPDFTDGMAVNRLFLDIQACYPDMMMDGVRIGSVYGCFPCCVANGGRAQIAARPYTADEIEAAFLVLDAYGVKARLTFTNMLAMPEHLEDAYVQQILSAGQRHGAGAIVGSRVVDDYIARVYPDMPRILSTTCEILDLAALDEATRTHDLVVLNYTKHRDDGFLSAIVQPQKIEVMVNEFCMPNCPRRMEHYRHISQDQLSGTLTAFACAQKRTPELFARILGHGPGDPVMLTNEDVARLNSEYAMSNFKIVGRGMPPHVVADALAYYLIRPEYRMQVKARVLSSMGC